MNKYLTGCLSFLTLIFLTILFPVQSTAQKKLPSLKITHLSGNVYTYQSFGEFNGVAYPTNSMYLVTSKGVVLFDTPWDTVYFQPLLDSIRNRHHQKVIMCFATHFHEDRTAGLSYYWQQGIQTLTTKATDSLCILRGEHRGAHIIPEDTLETIGGETFEIYYPGPGHSYDNIVIWFPKTKILYGGCFLKSTTAKDLGNLADANVAAWSTSLIKLKKKFPHPRIVIVGHNSWKNKRSIKHTQKLVKSFLKEHPDK